MRSRITAIAASGALALLAEPAGANSDVAAALAAGVVGVAVGASLANHEHHHHKSNPHFSPKPGIECYDRQRACYHTDGGYSDKWTWRIYG